MFVALTPRDHSDTTMVRLRNNLQLCLSQRDKVRVWFEQSLVDAIVENCAFGIEDKIIALLQEGQHV